MRFIDGRTVCRIAGFAASTLLVAQIHNAQAVPQPDRRISPTSSSSPTQESAANAEFRKGIEARMKGKANYAKERFLSSLKADPKFVPALIGLADIALSEGDKAGAEKYLKIAEEIAPRSAEVHLSWGRFHIANGRIDSAETAFNAARAQNPNALSPLLELGDLYMRRARFDDAQHVLQEAVRNYPNSMAAVYALGVAYAALGQRDNAFSAFEKATHLDPRDPAPYRAAGRLHMELGAVDKAVDFFDRGLKMRPEFVPLMMDRGEALARQLRWEDAVKQMERAAKHDPKSEEVQLRLADVYYGASKFDAAEAAYRRALVLNENLPLAYNNLAWMALQHHNAPPRAIDLARKAVSMSPNSAPFYDTLGWAQRAAGDLTSATKSLHRSIELEPKSAQVQYRYGVVLLEQENKKGARLAFERALQLDPRFSDADKARRMLQLLTSGKSSN